MKIAICEDDALCRKQLSALMAEYIAAESEPSSLFIYERGSELLEEARRIGGFDVYILDILMPGMNGIQLGLQLRQAGFDGRIVYLTATIEYAVDAFKVHASGYLVKPVQKRELFSTLDSLSASITEKRTKNLMIKLKESSMRLSFDSILYAELVKKNIIYHLVNGKELESLSIRTGFSDAVQPLLEDDRFTLCGTSRVINLHYISELADDAITFKNGNKLYISKRAGKDLRSVWYDYCFNEERRL